MEVETLQVRSLFHLPSSALNEVLAEEASDWKRTLHWDFHSSAELVKRYVGMRSLNGLGVIRDGQVIGYSYYVTESHKGLIGDLYVRPAYRSPENLAMLLRATLDELIRSPYVRRVEAQIMLLGNDVPLDAATIPPRAYPRLFMLAPLNRMPRIRTVRGIRIQNWTPRWMQSSASLIEETYHRHIDSQINDQYRDEEGALRFLQNIVQYPGCGQFMAPASFVALDEKNGELAGISLASAVAPETGHITQICVGPRWQGSGVGFELLRQSMTALRTAGYREVTLTVTESNEQAVRLYERVGFVVAQRFPALVWEGFLG